MFSYIFKILLTICFSLIISFFYYWVFSFHIENFDWYLPYLVAILIIYWIVKFFQINSLKREVIFTPLNILLFFVLHLFLLCILFFHFNWQEIWYGLVLFFKILFFSFFPLVIIFVTTAFGKKALCVILNKFSKKSLFFEDNESVFRFILSLAIWFFLFIYALTILWILWFYNLFIVFFLLALFSFLAYKELLSLLEGVFSYRIKLNNHNLEEKSFIKKLSLPLLSSEILFIISSLVISVSLINIVRPMPIGWDDLGVYMNYPRLLAWAWELLPLGSMFSWQVFTWIGYMFNSSNQAFFLNNVGWILSFIVLILIFKDLFRNSKKTFLNIPLLLATTFISMPMIVFQQAKDMKLDPWLFFISIIAFYVLYKVTSNRKEKNDNNEVLWWDFILILLVWVLCWFAFSIKFISLILISSLIWVLFFSRLWILWFLWYLSLFLGVFTKAWLRDYMNVAYPKDDIDFINKFFIFSVVLWLSFLAFSLKDRFSIFKKFLLEFLVFVCWILIALIPWFWKNISEWYTDISLSTLISWKSDIFVADYSKIYSEKEIDAIERTKDSKTISNSWTTSNEDFWRYFWYEKWINNYVKLPWNLTMQTNQKWEFTDIWFLFLALLPAILLFLPFKNRFFYFWIIFLLLLEFLVFINSVSSYYFTQLFSEISLPFWYTFILAWFLLSLFFFIFTLKKDKPFVSIFNINLVFSSFYVFLWSIAAFWVVWYWIVMYFSFLLMIWVWLYYLSSYEDSYDSKKIFIRFSGSLMILSIFFIYFFSSVIPHSFNNLKNANYPYYKSNKINSDEGIFLYHREYISMLFELNIRNDKKRDFILNSIKSDNIKKLIKEQNLFDITQVISLLSNIEEDKNIHLELKESAKRDKLNIYSSILSPSEDFKSKDVIYRIGTFLKYFITENNNRLLEDSLVFVYDLYIYDENSIENTVSRMKKLWLKYLLVDLNAATIDKDPRRDLTRRYENLLKVFNSNNLELIKTDSICLKLALEDYSKSDKTEEDLQKYISLAWVNYDSYLSGKMISNRANKMLVCYNHILDLISKDKISDSNYSYLLPLKKYITTNEITSQENLFKILSSNVSHGFKVLFKIKD